MTTNFEQFALNPALQSSLKTMGFETPTPIQAMAIPLALEGRDLLGSAQTGSGKTGAFCVPMLNYLLNNPAAHALVMLPTRELASQVHDVARKMIGEAVKGAQGIKTALLIGGEPIGKQYAQLDRRPRLIVGTPGRINDHLRGNPDLVDRVSFVVLDEADRMLDMGFAPQIDSILSETALERQTLMFSATFPDKIIKFSRQYLQNPERVSIGIESTASENIEQESLSVPQEQKYDELLLQLQKREGSVIIFVRTQHGADKLSAKLNKDEQPSESIHGGLRQRQREKVIRMFRKGDVRILVATDVAARGLDVPHIEHVVNYDLPQVAEDYIHRIGRTARAGAKGQAVSFISPAEKHLWRDIERMLNPDAPDREKREGGRGPKRGGKFGGGKPAGRKFGDGKFGDRKYGDGKKFAGHKSGEGKFGRKPFADGDRQDSGRTYDSPRMEEGGFKSRKPFGRADRKERRENAWNPDGDFRRDESAPRNADRQSRRPRADGDRSFAKPFRKREDGFRGREEFSGSEKPFRKPFRQDRDDAAGSRDRKPFAKPFRKDDDRGSRDTRDTREDRFRTDDGFKKPFRKNTNGQEGKPFTRSRNDDDRGNRRFQDGNGNQAAEGQKRPFKKPFAGKGKDNGGAKPFFKKTDGGRSGGAKSYSSAKKRAY